MNTKEAELEVRVARLEAKLLALSMRLEERWASVRGFDGIYSVSSHGRVRRDATGLILKTPPSSTGYAQVTLTNGASNTSKHHVHGLVAEAFLGQRPLGLQVNHKDGNRLNNRIENLEYVTASENQIHAVVALGSHCGESNPMTRLTSEEVVQIRNKYAAGNTTHSAIAKEYGIEAMAVGSIVRGDTWKHLGGPRTRVGYGKQWRRKAKEDRTNG